VAAASCKHQHAGRQDTLRRDPYAAAQQLVLLCKRSVGLGGCCGPACGRCC
jgi:hypothetical protein